MHTLAARQRDRCQSPCVLAEPSKQSARCTLPCLLVSVAILTPRLLLCPCLPVRRAPRASCSHFRRGCAHERTPARPRPLRLSRACRPSLRFCCFVFPAPSPTHPVTVCQPCCSAAHTFAPSRPAVAAHLGAFDAAPGRSRCGAQSLMFRTVKLVSRLPCPRPTPRPAHNRRAAAWRWPTLAAGRAARQHVSSPLSHTHSHIDPLRTPPQWAAGHADGGAGQPPACEQPSVSHTLTHRPFADTAAVGCGACSCAAWCAAICVPRSSCGCVLAGFGLGMPARPPRTAPPSKRF